MLQCLLDEARQEDDYDIQPSDEEDELTCSLIQTETELSSAQTEGKHSRNSQGDEQFQVQFDSGKASHTEKLFFNNF